jgi:catechol 2,3-dioxygenase-like lactoylglutathione lyase family enzyme
MPKAPSVALTHFGIYVTDIRKMEDFYSRFLGFTVTDRGKIGTQEFVFLSRDPKEHHQLVLAGGRPADTPFNVVNQISFRVDGLATLRDLHARLKNEPVSEINPVTHGNALSVYFRDPEGNRVELYMGTPWYVSQPLRIPLDLSLPDAQLWKWVEEKVRTLPGFKPHAQWQAELARRMGLS